MKMILELPIMAGLITALVEAIKRLGTPKKFLPFIAIALGVGAMYLTKFSPSHAELIFYGLIAGASAVGLFELGKQGHGLVNGLKKNK